MFKASADLMLPTSIIGSLPRPSWFTENLGRRSFLEAMVDTRYREQYEDAVAAYLLAQSIAGLDICTDGDAHYDTQVAGFSWQSYAPFRMQGFSTESPQPSVYKVGAAAFEEAVGLRMLVQTALRGQTMDREYVRRKAAICIDVVCRRLCRPGQVNACASGESCHRLSDRPDVFFCVAN